MNELEEAKLRQLFKNRSNCYADADDVVQAMDENCFIDTVKEWQAERMYSEEEVEDIIMKLMSEVHNGDITYGDYVIDFKLSPRKWFEQFKKK